MDEFFLIFHLHHHHICAVMKVKNHLMQITLFGRCGVVGRSVYMRM